MHILFGSYIIVTVNNFCNMLIVSNSSKIGEDKNSRNKEIRLSE